MKTNEFSKTGSLRPGSNVDITEGKLYTEGQTTMLGLPPSLIDHTKVTRADYKNAIQDLIDYWNDFLSKP